MAPEHRTPYSASTSNVTGGVDRYLLKAGVYAKRPSCTHLAGETTDRVTRRMQARAFVLPSVADSLAGRGELRMAASRLPVLRTFRTLVLPEKISQAYCHLVPVRSFIER